MLNHSFAALLSFTLIFCIIFLVTRKKAGALHYDEMQLQIRGDAYKLGFSAVIVLLAVTGLLYDADGLNISNYMTTDMLLFVILYAGVTVFAVYSILNNAFFRVLENGNRYLRISYCEQRRIFIPEHPQRPFFGTWCAGLWGGRG